MEVFRNDKVFPLFPLTDMTGGATYDWRHQYSGNSSVSVYQEGDAMGQPGSQSYLKAQAPVAYYKFEIGITGHALDQMRNGAPSAVFFNQWAMEYQSGLGDLVDLMSRDMLSTGTTAPVGIQGWISSSGTLAGVDRGTYTWFQAYQAGAGGTTIAMSDLNTADYSIRDSPNGGAIDLWLTSPKQKAKYAGAAGVIGASNNSLRIMVGPNGAEINGGYAWDGVKHGAAPILDMPNLTNTIWLGLQRNTWLIARQRAVQVDELGKVGDSTNFLVTCAYGLVCRRPKVNAKVTGLSA
jgi:hypothetical protein